jgi:bacteriocin-like protein
MMELDMKALNMNELSFNELEQISGGMSLLSS